MVIQTQKMKTEDPLISHISLSDQETDPYIHIMSNSSRNSSLSFIEIFQNRKQFQGINSIQNAHCVMITY